MNLAFTDLDPLVEAETFGYPTAKLLTAYV